MVTISDALRLRPNAIVPITLPLLFITSISLEPRSATYILLLSGLKAIVTGFEPDTDGRGIVSLTLLVVAFITDTSLEPWLAT